MNRFSCLVPIFFVIAFSQFVVGQAPIVTRDDVEVNILPQLETIDDQFDQATAETGNAWTRFVDNTKQALTQPFEPTEMGDTDSVQRFNPLGRLRQPAGDAEPRGRLVRKLNDRRKRLVKNTKQALTPNFKTPKITPPKITPPSFSTPMFNSGAIDRGNDFLKNIISPASSANTDKPRRSLLTSWLPSADDPEFDQPPTLGEWQSQERPQ